MSQGARPKSPMTKSATPMPNKIKPTPKRVKRHGSEVWVITEGNGTGTQSISRGRFHFPESQVDPRVKDLLRARNLMFPVSLS